MEPSVTEAIWRHSEVYGRLSLQGIDASWRRWIPCMFWCVLQYYNNNNKNNNKVTRALRALCLLGCLSHLEEVLP
jgi:hypothetical protein